MKADPCQNAWWVAGVIEKNYPCLQLLQEFTDPKILPKQYFNIFRNYCQREDFFGIRKLLELKVDINLKQGLNGATFLHSLWYDIDRPSIDMCECLIRNKADVNSRACFGMFPLHYAIFYTQHDVTKLLLEAKADVNLPAPLGDYCREKRKTDMIPLLEEYGTRIHDP